MTDVKMTEVHGVGDVRRLQTRNTIRAPVETVWAALTEIEHVSQWWEKGTIGSGAGESIRLGEGDELNGTIVLMMAPRIFEFTWHDEPQRSAHPEWIEPATRSLVRFDLIETAPETTLLTLVTFAPVAGSAGAAAGWQHLFEAFTAYVETGDATTPEDRFTELKALYE